MAQKMSRAAMRQMNQQKESAQKKNEDTIMDELLEKYETPTSTPEPIPEVQKEQRKEELLENIQRNLGGRPKKYDETVKTIKLLMTKENYDFVKQHGWRYDGMTGFINHLIDEERAKYE